MTRSSTRRRVATENPWAGRQGWAVEDELPILYREVEGEGGAKSKEPVEPAYIVYNDLVTELGFRPFRTKSGEPRVAIPTPYGLQVKDPRDQEFAAWVGYERYARRGRKINRQGLATVALVLGQRALARDLPTPRVVQLFIRFAPAERHSALLDLNDAYARCVLIGPGTWKIEAIAHPVFDARPHMLPLPDPDRSRPAYFLLWRHALVDPADRILAAAQHVHQLLAPDSAKGVTVLTGAEGAGKTSSAGRLQAAIDPSTVSTVEPPSRGDDDHLVNLALNHAIINLDNLSDIDAETSDRLCRLSTGAGLSKRQLYTDRGEIASSARPWVIINGISPTPRAADLLRRAVFGAVLSPEALGLPRLGDVARDELWATDHPRILAGLLNFAAETALVLRDRPPKATTDTMAEYTRIGRALSTVVSGSTELFDVAWARNLSMQTAAAAENPYVTVFDLFFRDRPLPDEGESAQSIAKWITETKSGLFPKGTSSTVVGQQLGRARATLKKLGVHIDNRIRTGKTIWFHCGPPEEIPEQTPPTPPLESFSDEKTTVGLAVGLVVGSEPIPPFRQVGSDEPHQAVSANPTEDSLTEPRSFGGVDRPKTETLPDQLPEENLLADGPTRADRARGRLGLEKGEP